MGNRVSRVVDGGSGGPNSRGGRKQKGAGTQDLESRVGGGVVSMFVQCIRRNFKKIWEVLVMK